MRDVSGEKYGEAEFFELRVRFLARKLLLDYEREQIDRRLALVGG